MSLQKFLNSITSWILDVVISNNVREIIFLICRYSEISSVKSPVLQSTVYQSKVDKIRNILWQ